MSYLCASSTLEEAAATLSRLLPVQMSARQALNLLQPLGEALQQQEDEQVCALWDQASQARTTSQFAEADQHERIERLYIELDGVFARLRRGSVPMEEQERKRQGDVYREVKVGAVCCQPPADQNALDWLPAYLWIRLGQSTMWLVARKRKTLANCSIRWPSRMGCSGRTNSWSWGMEPPGSGAWWPNTFLGLCKSWICGMPANMSGRWPGRSLEQTRRRPVPGLSTPATCWSRAKSRTSSQSWSSSPRSRPSQGPPVACRTLNGITSSVMLAACAIRPFARKRMHVGSGIAEAGCKTVVSTRAKRTGMRWTPEGLDAVLAVRTAVLNDTYDAFCEQHSLLVA